MKHVRIKGFKIFNDRHGKPRCYHRATGRKIDLEANPVGSVGFIAECEKIYALQEASASRAERAGTLGKLLLEYKASTAHRSKAPRSRSDEEKHFEYLRPLFKLSLTDFDTPAIYKLRDRAEATRSWDFANRLVTTLSIIFKFAVQRGHVKTNPAFRIERIKRPKDMERANRPWSDEECSAVIDALPRHMVVPISLMMYCGLDPKDALTLTRASLKSGQLDMKRAKTSEPVWLQLPRPVQDALAAAPQHDAITIAANSFGKPWTIAGFNTSWKKVRAPLIEAKSINTGLTLKGLRHTVATRLAEEGFDDRTIADFLGQKTTAMAQHYSNRANRSRKLAPVVASMDAARNEKRTEIVKPT